MSGADDDGRVLADWAREHVRDGVRAGRARRGRGTRRNRQVARGAPGAAAVLLRAAGRGRASSGPVVELDWRTCLRLSGDWWNEADPAAAVANLRAEAPAGDSVEIVGRIKAARGRPGGLMVRASARFVEAARLAQLPNGRGFETRPLVDWAGLRLPEGDR